MKKFFLTKFWNLSNYMYALKKTYKAYFKREGLSASLFDTFWYYNCLFCDTAMPKNYTFLDVFNYIRKFVF